MISSILWSLIGLTWASAIPPVGYRPVVLWHGLGDSYDSPGMQKVADVIADEYPGIYVHSVYLDTHGSVDQRRGMFGDVNEQLAQVCEQLVAIPEFEGGFDAIGFSQGGLFLRALAETCLDGPEMKKLITFGSPHNGIADLPTCGVRDFLCKQRNALLKSQIWSSYAQHNIVSAQYFRDPANIDEYLDNSNFLADINNEREHKNSSYKSGLRNLERFVMIMFSEDETVVPKESAWFQEVNTASKMVTPLERSDLYKEDWIGLKEVGEQERIDYLRVTGVHMEVSTEDLRTIAQSYLGTTQLPNFQKLVLQKEDY